MHLSYSAITHLDYALLREIHVLFMFITPALAQYPAERWSSKQQNGLREKEYASSLWLKDHMETQ